MAGSSPLARGLRGNILGAVTQGGIIPARAGFTDPMSRPSATVRDHPRSRGVYALRMCGRSEIPGSSPLARGLHLLATQSRDNQGIIPARAGFTPPPTPRSPSRPDHPRSRGVYDSCPAVDSPSVGSSPLARGLPLSSPYGSLLKRIIPARAGFTAMARLPPVELADHPRSRGVYGRGLGGRRRKCGSSPLARGLPAHLNARDMILRIIPARAGFTQYPAGCGAGAEDHPRSRGVYLWRRMRPPSISGSSPLARGLRGDAFVCVRAVRIIPARAGFTIRPLASGTEQPDHPRSRGVYTLL